MSQSLVYGLSAFVALLAVMAFVPQVLPASLTKLPLALRLLISAGIAVVVALGIVLMLSVAGWLQSTSKFEKGRADQLENAFQSRP